jgi:hypothetical protein
LDDTSNSTIIVGSIHTTTSLTDGTNIIGIETSNPQTFVTPLSSLAALAQAGSNNIQIPGLMPYARRILTEQQQPQHQTGTNNSNSNPFSALFGGDSATQSGSTTTSTNQTENTTQNEQNQEQQQQPQSIGVEVLADLIQNVMNSYTRFTPYLQQYHEMLLNDANEPPESPTRPPQPSSSSLSNETNTTNNSNSSNAFNFESSPSNQTSNTTATTPTSNPNVIALGADNRRQRFCNNINDMMHLLGHLFHNLSDLHVNIRDSPPRQMHTMNSMSHASAISVSAVPVEATIQIPLSVQFPAAASGATTANTQQGNSGGSGVPLVLPNIVGSMSGAGIGPAGAQPIFIRRRPRSTTSASSANGTSPNPSVQSQHQPQRPAFPISAQSSSSSRLLGPNPLSNASNYSTNNSYDQYLPCQSVHFYNSITPQQIVQMEASLNNQNIGSAATAASLSGLFGANQRRRHPAGNQQTSSTTTTTSTTTNSNPQIAAAASQQQQNTSDSSANQQQDLTRLISNIITSSMRNEDNNNVIGTQVGATGPIRVNIGK